jgi:hypothetical protein
LRVVSQALHAIVLWGENWFVFMIIAHRLIYAKGLAMVEKSAFDAYHPDTQDTSKLISRHWPYASSTPLISSRGITQFLRTQATLTFASPSPDL